MSCPVCRADIPLISRAKSLMLLVFRVSRVPHVCVCACTHEGGSAAASISRHGTWRDMRDTRDINDLARDMRGTDAGYAGARASRLFFFFSLFFISRKEVEMGMGKAVVGEVGRGSASGAGDKRVVRASWSAVLSLMPAVQRLMEEALQAHGDAHVRACWALGVAQARPGYFFAAEGALVLGVPTPMQWLDWYEPGAGQPVRAPVLRLAAEVHVGPVGAQVATGAA